MGPKTNYLELDYAYGLFAQGTCMVLGASCNKLVGAVYIRKSQLYMRESDVISNAARPGAASSTRQCATPSSCKELQVFSFATRDSK